MTATGTGRPEPALGDDPGEVDVAETAATPLAASGPAKHTTRQAILTGARWMTFSQGATIATQMVCGVVLARLLSPSEFGLMALVTLVQTFIQRVFKDLGTGSAIVQRKEASPQLLSSVFFLNFGWGALLTLAVLALADPLGWLMGDGEVVPLLRVACFSFVISSLGLVPMAVIRRKLNYRLLAVLNYLSFSASLLIAVALAAAGMGVWAMVVGGLSGSVLVLVLSWLTSGWRPIRHFDRADIREISSYSLNLTGYQLALYFTLQGDRLIIGRFVGTLALGYYSMATRLFLTPIQLFSTVFSEVLFPALSRVQDDRQTVGDAVVRATAVGCFALCPLLIGLSVVSRPLVKVLVGEQWLPAAPLISILALVGVVSVVQANNTTVFRSVGRTDLQLRSGIITAIATVTGYLAGAPWGVEGIALGYLVSSLVIAYPLHHMAFRLVDVKVTSLLAAVAPYFVASGVMAGAVAAARTWVDASGGSSVAELAVAVAVGAVTYGALMALWRPPALKDALAFVRVGRSRPTAAAA